jgi:hypothetical protein
MADPTYNLNGNALAVRGSVNGKPISAPLLVQHPLRGKLDGCAGAWRSRSTIAGRTAHWADQAECGASAEGWRNAAHSACYSGVNLGKQRRGHQCLDEKPKVRLSTSG